MSLRFLLLIAAVLGLAVGLRADAPGDDAAPGILTGSVLTHRVAAGDSLTALSARYGVPTGTLARLNSLRATARLQPGDTLIIDNRHIAPVIAPLTLNVPQRMLYFTEHGLVHAYPVAVGRADWPTPLGRFTVVDKEENPTWDVPLSIQEEMRRLGQPILTRVPPGPDNPLGAFFIRLSLPGIGLHGTNVPSSVYRFATHGCVRLGARSIADLYARVRPGTAGIIAYEPILLAEGQGRWWLEVHPDPYHLVPVNDSTLRSVAAGAGASEEIDWVRAAQIVRLAPGIAIDVTLEDD